MKIDFKGPRGFIFDITFLNEMLDTEGVFSPLAKRFVVERDLVEKLGLTVVSDIPQYPSLGTQYKQIRQLMAWHHQEVTDLIPENLVGMLRMFVVSVIMEKDLLLICLQKPIRRSYPCGLSVYLSPI